jgi:1-deoxy-D-xylulose-5-phosphate synthase
MILPDRFIDQATPEQMYETAGLDAKALVGAVLSALGREREASAGIA